MPRQPSLWFVIVSIPMRVLGRIRLSKSTEESTSLERQKELIQSWATDNGHEVVAWAEDVDVSGSVSPFDAPALGPYLQHPGDKEWDTLVAWKLDRLARNSINMHRLFGWIQDHDKQLVCISDNLDLTTWVGRMVASVIAGVAEGELEAIRERVTASKKKLRAQGRWAGGTPPYGYRVAERDNGGGYELEIDPEAYEILREIVERFINGDSANAIVEDLNRRGVTSPRDRMNGTNTGIQWSSQAVRRMLGSRTLLGWTTHEGRPVLDPEGKPILKAPPVVTNEEYEQLQATLQGRRWAKVAKDRTSPLLGVLECWHCGARMYHRRARNKASGGYYCSAGCKQYSVNDNTIHSMVEELFFEELGDFEVLEKVTVFASDVSRELEEAQETYQELASFITSTTNATARATLFQQLSTLEARINELEAQDQQEETTEYHGTGITYQQRWQELDTEQRRQLMISSGLRVRAQQLNRGTRHGPGMLQTEFIVPPDLRERLRIPA
ncbi:recombinase family protein [Corynebacterium guaraldiae]|uniref:Recombinase family protein n=2 Tax=Corynebacterium guaraldiae TaxID=3051103 RepID=A0ABY3D1D0_9CORY|nr:recombinase family protein [Corynebacterium guaraldiae]